MRARARVAGRPRGARFLTSSGDFLGDFSRVYRWVRTRRWWGGRARLVSRRSARCGVPGRGGGDTSTGRERSWRGIHPASSEPVVARRRRERYPLSTARPAKRGGRDVRDDGVRRAWVLLRGFYCVVGLTYLPTYPPTHPPTHLPTSRVDVRLGATRAFGGRRGIGGTGVGVGVGVGERAGDVANVVARKRRERDAADVSRKTAT